MNNNTIKASTTLSEEACAKRHYEISFADLPLSCPTREMEIWNAHPRIYLPIEELGEVTCPYCDAKFTLRKDSA